jgi:hypothetical protein
VVALLYLLASNIWTQIDADEATEEKIAVQEKAKDAATEVDQLCAEGGQVGEELERRGACDEARDVLDSPLPERGATGADGEPGRDGVDGRDGQPGTAGRDGEPGTDGEPGADGTDGRDGVTPPCLAEPNQCRGADGRDGVAGEDGAVGPPGPTCPDGYTARSRTYDPTPLVAGDDETWWVCVANDE